MIHSLWEWTQDKERQKDIGGGRREQQQKKKLNDEIIIIASKVNQHQQQQTKRMESISYTHYIDCFRAYLNNAGCSSASSQI